MEGKISRRGFLFRSVRGTASGLVLALTPPIEIIVDRTFDLASNFYRLMSNYQEFNDVVSGKEPGNLSPYVFLDHIAFRGFLFAIILYQAEVYCSSSEDNTLVWGFRAKQTITPHGKLPGETHNYKTARATARNVQGINIESFVTNYSGFNVADGRFTEDYNSSNSEVDRRAFHVLKTAIEKSKEQP